MTATDPLRSQLVRLLDWHEAHVTFDKAVDGVPLDVQGRTPAGSPFSPWQLLEHLRIAQHDILEFCVNPAYDDLHKDVKWPDDYWPKAAAPPNARAWQESVAAYEKDREGMKKLVRDPAVDLFGRIPHGTGQTYLREVLLVVDHGAYHVGQMVLARRLLGAWPE
jgi:uncharacterized damage-inducible protein DinB